MAFNGYVDDPFDVMCEGLFDNIEDILDFSNGDNALMGMVVDAEQLPPPPPPLPVPTAPAPAPAFASSPGENGSGLIPTSEEHKICDELNISEDWLSNFLDDTVFNLDLPATATATATVPATVDDDNHCMIKTDSLFRSSSPVSVLERSNLSGGGRHERSGSSSISSSSSSNSINNDIDIVSVSVPLPPPSPPGPAVPSVPARARTKRSRPAAFTPRIHITGPSLPASCLPPPMIPTPPCSDYSSIVETFPPLMKKKKKKCPPFASAADAHESSVVAAAVRKCMHCGIQKTPQWRAGPMGPKTLCNACGVRYKSGRLFPEYRPAASPTFVPAIHSNSHKKVVEMRIKATSKETTSSKVSPAAKNCDLLLYIRRKE
ncbi:putative GATA transcription factor 11 [Iris pallida]|uniref:GATA transcription factor 11 n=1 Tax=Iris pallida TaxID=29817 RepID=A0AAX6G8X7_IRIPA|nr:putative GATA transcription factor 11 [Iris pallida]